MSENTQTRGGYTVTGTRTRGATVTRFATERTGLAARADASRRVLSRAGDALSRAAKAVGRTVRPAGWLLVGALAGGLIAALAWGWTEAWVIAVAAAVLLTCSAPFLLGKQNYAVRLQFDKDRVVAGHELTAVLDVENVGTRIALPSVLDIPVGEGLIEAHLPLLRPTSRHDETLTVGAERRGIIEVGPMTVRRGDPIGLLQRDHTWPDIQHVYVHPVTVVVPSTSAGMLRDLEGASTKTIVDSDLSFHAIREYQQGDSSRHIDWKSTAKTGRYMVRQFEETRRARIAIVLDLDPAQYASDDEFEVAVSAASSLALQAVRDGRELTVTTSAEIPPHARGVVHAIRTLPTLSAVAMLDGMSGVQSSPDVMPLESVATMTAQESERLSLVLLVVGSQTPVARLRKAAARFSADITVIAVRAELGGEPSLRTARELRVLTIGMLGDLGHMLLRSTV